jgi:hypothetical protein
MPHATVKRARPVPLGMPIPDGEAKATSRGHEPRGGASAKHDDSTVTAMPKRVYASA